MLNTSTSRGTTKNGKPALIIHTDYGDLTYTAFALKALRQELAAVDQFIAESDQTWRRQNPPTSRTYSRRYASTQASRGFTAPTTAAATVPTQTPAPSPKPQPQPQPAQAAPQIARTPAPTNAPLTLPPPLAPQPMIGNVLDNILADMDDQILDLNF